MKTKIYYVSLLVCIGFFLAGCGAIMKGVNNYEACAGDPSCRAKVESVQDFAKDQPSVAGYALGMLVSIAIGAVSGSQYQKKRG